MFCFSGHALEKAGGKEFVDEVVKLRQAQSLDTSGGKDYNNNNIVLFTQGSHFSSY